MSLIATGDIIAAMVERKASVIVPAYNVEKYIGLTIESVLVQKTSAKTELVIVNDGSTDKTAEIARKYQKDFGGIVIVDQDNQGVAAARNLGVEKASGGTIVFLDGDDVLKPDAVEVVTSCLEIPGIEYVFSDHEAFNDEGVILYKTDKWQYWFEQVRFYGYQEDKVIDHSAWHGHVKAINHGAYDQVGGFRSEFESAEDYDFILRVYDELGPSKIEIINQVLYGYRVREGSLSSVKNKAENGRRALEASLRRRGINAGEVLCVGRNITGLLHYAYKVGNEWFGLPPSSLIRDSQDLSRIPQGVRNL